MDQVLYTTAWGEAGLDPEASPGVGSYYVKVPSMDYDASGFDTLAEAIEELEALAPSEE